MGVVVGVWLGLPQHLSLHGLLTCVPVVQMMQFNIQFYQFRCVQYHRPRFCFGILSAACM